MAIPHENRHTLQKEYSILTNFHPSSDLNQLPAELAHPMQKKCSQMHQSPLLSSASTKLPPFVLRHWWYLSNASASLNAKRNSATALKI